MSARPNDADAVLDRALETTAGEADVEHTVVLERPWRSPPDTLSLAVRYRIRRAVHGASVEARVGPHEVALDRPQRLESVQVNKPWGREIWFSGIEARGESGVVTGAGVLPLSHYLALAPRRLTGLAPVILLKVLDPNPQPVIGDLYFEVHEEKREVYVVTHVDPTAWPDGSGRIRFGMNQALRRRYADDAAFRRAYLAAVRDYEQVRRAIDTGEAVAPGHEAGLRAAMDAFTSLETLRVGDVVVVPNWLPHSLQHGVRVVEFQTPTYERYILSFAQRVLTQEHWDTADALARIRLDRPPPPRFQQVGNDVEQIVAFDDFGVWRIRLAPGASQQLPSHPGYAMCMVVGGRVDVGGLELCAEQAAFVPGSALSGAHHAARARLHNPGPAPALVLAAAPNL